MSRIAHARPPMLATSATPKTTVGQSLVKPSLLPSAVAHTASRMPERMRMTHDMTATPGQSCRSPGTDPSSGGPVGTRLRPYPSGLGRPWAGSGQQHRPAPSDEEEPVQHAGVVRVHE